MSGAERAQVVRARQSQSDIVLELLKVAGSPTKPEDVDHLDIQRVHADFVEFNQNPTSGLDVPASEKHDVDGRRRHCSAQDIRR